MRIAGGAGAGEGSFTATQKRLWLSRARARAALTGEGGEEIGGSNHARKETKLVRKEGRKE